MQALFQKIVTKANENKATLIRIGGAVAGALVGASVAVMLTGSDEDLYLDLDSDMNEIEADMEE